MAADHGILPLMPCKMAPAVDDYNGEEVVYIVDLEKCAPPPFMPITPVEWQLDKASPTISNHL